MIIKKATAKNYEQFFKLNAEVQSLHAKLYPGVFRQPSKKVLSRAVYIEYVKNNRNIILFVFSGKQAVGYIFATIQGNRDPLRFPLKKMYINHLSVSEFFQKRGIATKLLEKICRIAERKGIRSVQLDVWAGNRTALQFFRRKGFKIFNTKMELFLGAGSRRG